MGVREELTKLGIVKKIPIRLIKQHFRENTEKKVIKGLANIIVNRARQNNLRNAKLQ